MGPIPKRSFIVEPLPLSATDRSIHAASRLLRALPPRMVRLICAIDLLLCCMPFWMWFWYRRWTGIRLSGAELRRCYTGAAHFAHAHIFTGPPGTGAGAVDWGSPPIRHASARERTDYPHQGSCSTCVNCCTTHWLPEPARQRCPLLGEDGCRVYGGVYWDYFNCGRYPLKPPQVRAYGCPRFEGPIEIPDVLPEDIGRDAETLPSRLRPLPMAGGAGGRAGFRR